MIGASSWAFFSTILETLWTQTPCVIIIKMCAAPLVTIKPNGLHGRKLGTPGLKKISSFFASALSKING
jgi:hypothetical protein